MSKLWLARRGKVLIPTDQQSERFIRKMEPGECAVFEASRPRSVQWNRMYWALCRSIGENQDPPRDESSIDLELRIRAGHFEIFLMDGHEIRVPKTIRFAEMDADAWAELWPSIEQAITDRFGAEYIQESRWT
jgi:hypothetical protein